ncbi:MAG: DUF2238 domain-containing protein [Myxococcales bacterium]|nr:MAG: DUF2238 domain-containing protein [Myxococcales bacterium]
MRSGSGPCVPAPSLRGVASFTAGYMVCAALVAWRSGNTEFAFYIVVMAILIAIVWIVHTRARLTAGALWALSLWGLLHMLGGLVRLPDGWPMNEGASPVLYSLWLIPDRLKYDQVVHAYGFGVTTWVCWQGLRSALRAYGIDAVPTLGLVILVWAAGLGFGAVNEVVEFAATLLIPETNVGGYMNTGWDLVSNTLGATVAAVVIYLDGR